jgi:3-deoxy-D-manno-octulosonic-acid transferase
VRAAGHACRLLLVPRHAERRKEIEATVADSGFTYHFRSRGKAPSPVEIAVADTTGELRRLSQVADLVFVGKSLPPHHEGQTPVEAAALGKPILFGPEMSNFRVIARELRECGAALAVADAQALAVEGLRLLADPEARARMASAAVTWHRANQGAGMRTLEAISRELVRRTR